MWYNELTAYAETDYDPEQIRLEEVVIGAFLTYVKITGGAVGIASNLFKDSKKQVRTHQRRYGMFTPGNLNRLSIQSLFSVEEIAPIHQPVKAAAANALSALLSRNFDFKKYLADPIDLMNFSNKSCISLVGAFGTYMKRFVQNGIDFNLIELNPNAVATEFKPYYRLAEESPYLLAKSDAVIITGSSFVNGTLENVLRMTNPEAEITLVGPSAGLFPKLLFDRNVKYIGSMKIIDNELVKRIISEGGTGYHLFPEAAQKITIVNE